MKTILSILLALSFIALTSCQKYGTFQTYFWTSSEPGTTNYLFVNDTNRGILPYLPQGPSCNDEEAKKHTLYLPLESGTYRLAVMDKQGIVKHTQTLTVKLSSQTKQISTNTKQPHAGSRSVTEGDCLVEEIYY